MKSNFTSIMLSGAAVAAAMLLLAGCAKENGLNQWMSRNEGCTELELTDVNSGEMLSKAAIDGTGFPRDGRIGLFFFKDEAGAELYGDSSCSNVEYSYNQDKSKWTASPAIRVGSTPGYLYGYYPYNGANKDVKAIAVESSLDGDDAMYVAKQDPVTDQTAGNVAITMRHALARVSITVKNKGYSGAAKLSRIEFVGAKTAPSGTLNALDGSITATKSDVTLEVPEANQDITAAGTRYECLLVPSEVDVSAQDVTLRFTIDGQQKTVALTGENALKIVSGVKARLEIDLSDSGLSLVDGIQVDDWQTVTVGGHKVTVKFSDDVAAHDILTDIYVEGSSAIINAWSKSGEHLNCTLLGGELCPQSKTDKLGYTFTLFDISSDVIATIGYAESFTISDIHSNNTDWGRATFIGDCFEGEKITFIATAQSGCQFVEWQDAEGKKLDWTNPQDITLISNLSVKAVFKNPAGAFSISNDGGATTNQIHFSKGNLWYGKVEGAETATFNFENKQYEYHTYDSYSYTWGLFGWSTNSAYGMNTSTSSSKYSGDFKDWGTAIDKKGTWRTLSKAEWNYLFKGRINASDKYGYASVNNVHGIIILPDTFTDPKTNKGGNAFAPRSTTGWDANVYTAGEDWEAMESAGAVFLPAAGFRNGTRVGRVGGDGYYWSSSLDEKFADSAFNLHFISGTVSSDIGHQRFLGCCVRLVTEYQSEPSAE